MSFSSMHNDYLDPDRHLPPEDYGFDLILSELKKHNTGKWRWDHIDCSWTGKDADLESWGNQGCKLISVDEEHATVSVHAGKTFVGTDVTLNLPKSAEDDEELLEQINEIWMSQAQEIVLGCGSSGEWDGDSWWMTTKHTIKVPVTLFDDGNVNAEKTASSIVTEAKKSLKQWEDEIRLSDDMMSVLAGWKCYDRRNRLVPCKEGRPGKGSVWSMYRIANVNGGAK